MSDSQRTGAPPHRGEVLIVDDMSTIRIMLSQHVRQLGHGVTGASNGQEALELLRSKSFDLVLLDVMMPGMDGYTVLEQIKTDIHLRDIPVVMISGVDELQSVVRCIERGADDYLPKPFNATLLRARIESCLAKKRLWDELGEKYRELQELETLRDSLTHMIVHDLRAPLTSILTGLQTVQMGGPLPDHQQEFLTMAISGGSVLLGMINDLLDVNKMEAGFLELEYQELDPMRLIEQSIAQVAAIAQDKNIHVIGEADPGLPTFSGDEDKLRRTLVNLLGNAVKFTGSGGSITVSIHLDDAAQAFTFSVSDTGQGIPADAFSRVFEKFGQVQSGNANRKMSTGLGLTFCKMAVEAHGGRIWVESELGKGSTFLFIIPRG